MSWLLVVVMYTGQINETRFQSLEDCEFALLTAVDYGDSYTVILATSDAENKRCEKNGYHFIGRGVHDFGRFCAYLKLN